MSFLERVIDRRGRERWLVSIGYWDPATGTTGTFWFGTTSDRITTSYPITGRQLTGADVRANLKSAAAYQVEPFGARELLGLVDSPLRGVAPGEVRLANKAGDLDFLKLRGYVFEGQPLTEYVAVEDPDIPAASGAQPVYKPFRSGVTTGVDHGFTESVFSFAPGPDALTGPLQNRRFDGSDWMLRCESSSSSYVSLGTPSKLDLSGSGALTIAAKIRAKSIANTGAIISWRKSTTTAYPFAFGYRSTGELYLAGSAITTVSTVATLTAGRVYEVAVTVVGKLAIFYIWDIWAGGALTTETFTLSAASRAAHSGGELRINHHNGINTTDCVYSWLLVANRVWSSDELAELQNRQLTADEMAHPSTKLALRFQDGTGATSLLDESASPITATFSGSPVWVRSFEGGETLAGQVKPDVWGAYNRMSPVLVSDTTQVYCISGWETNAVNLIDEGGSPLTYSGTTWTNPERLDTAAPAAGDYDLLIWEGGTFVKLGADPTNTIAATGEGTLSSGKTYPSTCDDIIAAILQDRCGFTSLQVSDLATGSNATLQLVELEPIAVADVLAKLLKSVGGVGWISRPDASDGSQYFRTRTWTPLPAPSDTIAGYVDQNVLAKPPEPVRVDAPPRVVNLLHSRNFTPIEREGIAPSVVGTAGERELRREAKSIPIYIASRRGSQTEVEIDTCLTTTDDAEDAAARIADYSRRVPGVWRITLPAKGLGLELLDWIGVRWTDHDLDGREQVRMGFGSGLTHAQRAFQSSVALATYIDLGTSINYALNSFTIEARCWPDATGATGLRCLTSREVSSSDRNWWLGIWDASVDSSALTDALVFRWSSGGEVRQLSSPFSVVDGQDHSFAAVFNGDGGAGACEAYLLVDGAVVDRATGLNAVDTPVTANVLVGRETGTTRYWAGYISEIRIHGGARDLSNVYASRDGLRLFGESDPLAWLKLDELPHGRPVVVNHGSEGPGALNNDAIFTLAQQGYGLFRVIGMSETADASRGEVSADIWRAF